MTVLGIETSSMVCSVGLADERGPLAEESISDSHIHSEKLQTMVQSVLNSCGTDLRTIDAIAVSIGPGSFTGLRIGLSSAKGFCYGIEKPLLPVSSFDALAEAVKQSGKCADLAVIIDAKQGDFYSAGFQFEAIGNRMVNRYPVAIRKRNELSALLNESALIVTDCARLVPVELQGRTVLEAQSYFKGSIVAMLGSQLLSRKTVPPIAEVEPFYLKDFVVHTTQA